MEGVAAHKGEAGDRNDPRLFAHLPLDSWKLWAAFAVLGAGSLMLFVSFGLQLIHGHAITGQSSHGAVWGVVVANIINFIGISHVGIAISAVVRILKLRRYEQLARLAELVTLASITTAVLNIAMDVGHPERFIINVVYFGRYHSPFVWSATVITTYVFGSSVYLYLAMRRDIATCIRNVPSRKFVFRLMALGYEDTPPARSRHNRVVWWLAVIILPIMVSVHSVYGYIFGLQAGRPGWYNPFQAPYFVLGAICSGFSTVIVLLAILRKAFHWEEIFPPRIFKGLGIFLGFVTLVYMYFLFSEWLTGVYASPEGERMVFRDVLFGRFAPITWTAVAGMLIPFAALFIQGSNPKICSIPLTVVAALLINLSLWTVRAIVVVPTFYHPLLPWDVASYVPTISEWGMVAGSFFFFGLLLLILIKALPVLELPETPGEEHGAAVPPMPLWKKVLVGGTALTGATLIATGISLRLQPELYHPPVIWITGIVTLLSVPFQICVLPEGRRRRTSPVYWRQLRALDTPRVRVERYATTAAPGLTRAARFASEQVVPSREISALHRPSPIRSE